MTADLPIMGGVSAESVPVYLLTPENLGLHPEGPFLLPSGFLPEVGQELTLSRGGRPWWEPSGMDVREIAAVRWQLLWPMRANEQGTIVLVLKLGPRRPPEAANRG